MKLPERTVQSVRVRGIAPERAPFDLRASLPGARGTMSFKLERLPLAQFTPYAASAADLRIPKGELSLDTKGSLANSGAAGKVETRVVVHQLSIQGGPNAISVAGMPLDLALALLRDPQGDIALPIPVEYGEQGASAGIGTILLGALRAAITGAVTSPIKAMGVLLPEGGAAEISFAPVAFAAGDAAARPMSRETLAPLASLLAQRPGLGLALVGHAGRGRPAGARGADPDRAHRRRSRPACARRTPASSRAAACRARSRSAGAARRARSSPRTRRCSRATSRPRDVPAERYTDLARRRAEAVRDVLATAHALAPARVVAEAGSEAAAPEVVPELRVGAAQ